MAYINGNKPIVTDGLVYALDFGNTKSYTSGSNRARSLVFDTATTIVTGSTSIPVLSSTGLTFTGSQFIQRSASLSALDPNGAFTICAVVKANTAGTLFTQNSATGNLSGRFQSTSSLSTGFSLSSGDFSRIYTGNFTGSQHLTYRYSSGSIDTFINGIPVTASQANLALTGSGLTSTLFINSGSLPFSGSLSSFYVYNRALSADEIYQNFEIASTRYGLPYRPKPYTQDENVYKFLQTTGITDSNTVSAISTFVSGLKSAGLWNKMTAIYPFLSTSTGSQTVNLKDPGVLGLGLTGSFSASAAGLTPSSSTAYVDALPSNIPYPLINSASAHLSLVSYDVPQGNGFLAGNSAPAVGGDVIIQSGSRILHAFKTVGTSSFIMTNPSISNVEVLVVGGGGAGGNSYGGGGGGAGGLVYSSSFSITPGSPLQVIIGNGGAGSNGGNSVFGTITAFGGGKGGDYRAGAASSGSNGGSGGGAGNNFDTTFTPGGLGTPGQGTDGGYVTGSIGHKFAGGGGGAGSSPSSSLYPRVGGSGSFYGQFSLVGGSPAGWFAGGGGGGSYTAVSTGGSFGGIGGGGAGVNIGVGIENPVAGATNTGGGGGGSGGYGGPNGANGGSGIVIVSYDLPSSALTGSGTGFYLTDSAITASVNSQFTSGITGSGNIGFLTVSRTGSNTFSIHKNNISQSVASASLGALSSDIFFNTANLAGSGSLPLPNTLAYASIGAGLTTTEVSTYYNLVSQLQNNLKRQNTLLDNFSGAAAAYSLRRIGPSGYFGPAIRVRRDSDNALRDIGFTSDGQLDTVGLLDFVGVTGSGFVQTWYDQSGNNNNATQATAGSQPLVITSGSVITEISSKKPILNFFSSTFLTQTATPNLLAGATSTEAYPSTIITRFNISGSTSRNGLFGSITVGATTEGTLKLWAGGQGNGPNLNYDNTLYNLFAVYNYPSSIGRYTGLNRGAFFEQATVGLVSGYVTGIRANYFGTNTQIQEHIIFNSDKRTIRTDLENNIYNYYTTGSDTDYQSFITATGITQPTQSAALETLVSDLKSYGLWNKMKAIYPMITDKNNRFAYSEEFDNGQWNKVGTVVTPNASPSPIGTTTGELVAETTTPTGSFTVTNNGASAYTFSGDATGDNPTLTLQRGVTYSFYLNASGHPFYIMTGSGAYSVDGQYNTGVTGQGTQTGTLTFTVPSNAPDTLAYVCQVHSSMGGTINVINNTNSHHIYQTIDSLTSGNEYVASVYGRFNNRPWIAIETNAGAKAWFNIQTGITGSLTGSRSTITNIGSGWYRCALYFTSSVASGPQNIQYHLADADNNLTYTGISGTGSFMWGAQFENGNVLGPYRATTTVGFTTGSMLDQMKYNLKNPVDTDAGFRLTYSGTPNIGFAGINMSGSRIDTNYYPSRSGSLNNEHITLYKSKDGGTTRPNQADIQGYNSTILNGLYTNYYGTILYENGNSSNGTYAAGITNPGNNVGMYAGTRINNQISIYKNQSKLIQTQVSASSAALTTGNLKFGVYTDNISGHNRVYSFSTIGDGLTDYEAKALYWIVQKYQTTLGRQVY